MSTLRTVPASTEPDIDALLSQKQGQMSYWFCFLFCFCNGLISKYRSEYMFCYTYNNI